ncbi:hypothetical protein F5Y12DRAFT_710156 [Xylaria sp. FL1777]|nr:hypothetical protein F5Y12DRAFT_710156 [Xylaria sp. FL1777]
MGLFIVILSLLIPFSSSSTIHPALLPAIPKATSGNTNCSAASSNTTFQLTFISYGNWTAQPSQDENPIQHLESFSLAVSNTANAVSTVCAFSLGARPVGVSDGHSSRAYPLAFEGALPVSKGESHTDASTGPAWQACADRKDTDGKNIFTIATGAAFGLAERSLAVNQTWFCHDDAGRLVAFTGVANTVLNLTCSESEVSGYHLQNCTSPDLTLTVTLL